MGSVSVLPVHGFVALCCVAFARAQLYSASDRSPQELALLDWTSGIRMAYCQELPVTELTEPFLQAITKMVNRHCRNATACRLRKPVTFSVHHVVLLEGYPRRTHRAVDFRFFVVLPPDASPLEQKLAKPLLSNKILADVLRVQISEFTQRLGWQILSVDKFPRYDAITTFMNRALIPIGIVAGIFMLFLAYWSSTMSSSSYSSEGWMVSGSTGGKNAALRRTLEIIEEQKYHQEQERRLQMAVERKQALAARTALAMAGNAELVPNDGAANTSKRQETVDDSEDLELGDQVPEIVVLRAQDSYDTLDSVSGPPLRKMSYPPKQKGRRFSAYDDFKRKSRPGGFNAASRTDRQKKWKTGSLMLFGSRDN